MTCGTCARENAADARFCSACGAPLYGADGDQARKVVTVVFTDLVGSTALGERLDPEALRAVMSRWFAEAETTLARYGGRVEKFIGDAVMAVFGVPAVHEDDPLRAVRAACDLRDALDRLNADLERHHGVRLATRTGVNTGEVVVGSGAGDQRLATGDAVNVAARLQTAAGPGDVLVGRDTFAAVQDAVVAEAVGAVDAKGKTAAVEAWRVIRPRPDVPAFGRPIATPFIGRERELELLRRLVDDAADARHCALATVLGTPGIGKSRLARELVGSLEREARVFVGRCTPYGQDIPYLPFADLVRDVAGDDPEAELRGLFADGDGGAAAARLVAGAVGAGDGAGSADETAWAFRRLLETLAAERPVVLVLDDIHWADGALLDLLEYVAGFSTGAPLFVLCLARPDLLDARPSWAAPRARTMIVALDPLEPAAAQRLVDGLAAEGPLAEPVRRRIVDSAEGNPLFVEQMLAMLAEDPGAAETAVPATIHALLAARIDRLEPEERDVLQRAAVEGRLFHRSIVAELLAEDDPKLGRTLLALTRKEFVRPDRSLFPGDDAFRFNHVLIRDVAYGSLPKRIRAALHARLADWLEQHAEGRLTGADQLVGLHLEQAYDSLAELGPLDAQGRALALRGGHALARAGLRAVDRQEPGAGASLLGRAARLLEVAPAERLLLLPDLGRALRESGRLDDADPVLGEATEAARARDDTTTACRAEVERARLAFMRATVSPDELRAVGRRAVAVFGAAGSDAYLADAWQVMGIAELSAGDRGAQLEAVRRARTHAIASGDVRRQIDAWNEVGGAMLYGRTPVLDVLAFLEEELAWARERGLPAVEADALLGGPYLLPRLGRFEEGREQLERSKEICRELGIPYGLAEAHYAGSELELIAGDLEAAERELRDAIRIAEEMGADRYAALYRTCLAAVLVDAGRHEDAAEELERADDYRDRSRWRMAYARVLARRGALAEAVRLAEDAAARPDTPDDITWQARQLAGLADVLRLAGDAARAAEALVRAIALHEEKGNVVPAEQLRAALADLSPAPA